MEHCLLSIVYCQLAVNTLQPQGFCKLSLVTFNCHFIYFVIQLTVCSCPKLPLLTVFYPLTLTPYPLSLFLTGHALLIGGCQFGIACYNSASLSYRGKSSSARLQLTCHCFLLETSNQNLVSFTDTMSIYQITITLDKQTPFIDSFFKKKNFFCSLDFGKFSLYD